jgi:hypothetical protein
MPQHDFSQLFECYPAIISQMPARFDSHQFILRLAQENQKLYIEALYHYRDSSEPEAPFMVVHGILARHLLEYPELIKHVGTEPSENIFGQVNACANWEMVAINK